MPGTDGFELCRLIRATKGCEGIPVLFFTGSHEASDYRKNFAAGGNGYLVKPVGRRQLLTAIEGLLEESRVIARPLVDTGGGD